MKFLLKNFDKIKNTEKPEADNSDEITEELKRIGMEDEEIEDLNSRAEKMSQFLAKVMTRDGLASHEDIFYNTQVKLVGKF